MTMPRKNTTWSSEKRSQTYERGKVNFQDNKIQKPPGVVLLPK